MEPEISDMSAFYGTFFLFFLSPAKEKMEEEKHLHAHIYCACINDSI